MVLLLVNKQHQVMAIAQASQDELDVQIQVQEPNEPIPVGGVGGISGGILYDVNMHNGNAPSSSDVQQTPSRTPSSSLRRMPSHLDPDFHDKSCRINIMLVCCMFCVGLAIAILGVFMHMLGSFSERDCVIWSGVPVSQ